MFPVSVCVRDHMHTVDIHVSSIKSAHDSNIFVSCNTEGQTVKALVGLNQVVISAMHGRMMRKEFLGNPMAYL